MEYLIKSVRSLYLRAMLDGQNTRRESLILSVYGVEMAWATVSIPFVYCRISDIVVI